jgi:hypothetical protein
VTAELEPTRGQGPVGTGVHLLRRSPTPEGATVAEVWLTFVFLPVVPLGKWTLAPAASSGSSWVVGRVDRPSLPWSAAWIAGGLLAALTSLVPAWLAVTFFMGSKPAEIGGLFTSAGAIIAALGWLDGTRARVPVRTALRVLARAGRR